MPRDSAITEVLYRDTVEGSERRLAFLLRSVSTMLAIVYGLQALWLNWRGDGSELLRRFAFTNALVFFTLRLALAKIALPKSWSQPLAGIATMFPVLYAIAGLKISGEPWGTAQLLVVILMAGFVFTSRAWFTAVVIVACTGWFWTAFHYLSNDAWVQLGLALLATVIWSMWFLETRIRSLSAFEQKVAEQEQERVRAETQFFQKPTTTAPTWCPVCYGSPDAVIRHDSEKILDVNGSATEMLGLSRSELMAMAPINLFALENRLDKKFLSFENFDWSEKVALRKDKSRAPVDVINVRLGKENGGTMALVLRDASLRARARERAAAATERTQILVRRQADLAQLGKMSDAAGNRAATLKAIVTVAHRALPCSIGAVIVLQEGEARVEASSAASELDIHRLRLALLTWLMNKRESVIYANVGADPDGVREIYRAEKIESLVATPIISTKGVAGFILTLENVPREYAPADIDFLTALAYRASTAIKGG